MPSELSVVMGIAPHGVRERKGDLVRFLHSSDWHLGIKRHYFAPEGQLRYSDDQIERIKTVISIGKEKEADFILIAGDVFDSNHIERAFLRRSLDALKSTVPIIILPGNHDALTPDSVYFSSTFKEFKPENVSVLGIEGDSQKYITDNNIEMYSLFLEKVGVEIVGIPISYSDGIHNVVNIAAKSLPPDYKPRILIGHGQLDILSPNSDLPIAFELMMKCIDEGRFNYLALGDHHSFKDIGKNGTIVYSGAFQATDIRDDEPGNIIFVDLERFNMEKVDISRWRFEEIAFELMSNEDTNRFTDWLKTYDNKERSIVKINLSGSVTVKESIGIDEVIGDEQSMFASLRVDNNLRIISDSNELESLELNGIFLDVYNELKELVSQKDPEVARDAFKLFFRLVASSDN